ncbi:MAG TPA: oxygenase MpaB family protein [Aeromicrobium sp.]|jgi:uncharacterized protein (DUF2236 family)|nr:oxygenase MpaB family protein [Aeromicrobium sp.]HKY58115.1 oxygenase MpaB family protein [Aeromicrobium sp.]
MSATESASTPAQAGVPASPKARPNGAGRKPAGFARDVPVPEGFTMARHMSIIGARLAGPANFTMQLAWPGVGYGVLNSRVESGSALKHPIKRTRTTFTYLAVAMLGTEKDRAAYRKAVNRQHAQVVSTADEPVQYRAMDPRLQTWVAACLYYGTIDMIEKMHGAPDDATADAIYAYGARFGTTLQMPADAWPVDRAAFDRYWEDSLAEVRIDEPVRELLMTLIRLDNMPWWLKNRRSADFGVFITTGFLPPPFREAMKLAWTDDDQARFDRLMQRYGRRERLLPRFLRVLPFRLLLWDMRIRQRLGLPLV